jgi:putative acetyltransferase
MSEFIIRPILPEDCPGVATLIRTVMPEFGACGPGFAIHDPEVDDMYSAYTRARHVYYVITDGKQILGGGGVAPLTGEEETTCELRKMYFMKEIRGKGLGQKVMDLSLMKAKEFGFRECYLETLKTMEKAQILYRKNGFLPISAPRGATGHFSCDAWYLKQL